MVTIHSVSSYLANKLAEITNQRENTNKMTYGLELILGESSKLASLLLTAYIFDLFTPMLILLLVLTPLRVVIGGGHCTSSMRCLITAEIMYMLMALGINLMAKSVSLIYLFGLSVGVLCLLTVIVDRTGPGVSINYPNPSPEKIDQIKRIVFYQVTLYTIGILVLYAGVQNSLASVVMASAAIGGLWQSIMATVVGEKIISIMDKGLLYAKIK